MRTRYLGAFAETFGIRPWEWDQLSPAEARGLAHYIEEREAAADG